MTLFKNALTLCERFSRLTCSLGSFVTVLLHFGMNISKVTSHFFSLDAKGWNAKTEFS